MDFSAQSQNVPTFQFSLKDFQTADPLFSHRSSSRKKQRRPGSITNMQKSTVSHLLQVFRPAVESPEDHEQFSIKKKLVTEAIHVIYDRKQTPKIHQINKIDQRGSLLQRNASHSPQTMAKNRYSYKTPNKTKDLTSYNSTNVSMKFDSSRKLNYSKEEQMYTKEEIQKLRVRSGCAGRDRVSSMPK